MSNKLSKREEQRIRTTKERHGDNVYSEGGKKMWREIKRRLGEQDG